MAQSQSLLPFFKRSLAAFLSSTDGFRVLSTAPHLPAGPRGPPSPGIKTLVILDSSFNPPTTAHAQMARSAMRDAGPDARLVLLLAVQNADKGSGAPAAMASRLGMMDALAREMVSSATTTEVDVAVTRMALFGDKAEGIARSGWYAGREQPRQVFLCGFDTLVRVFDERYYPGGRGGQAMEAALGGLFAAARLRVTMRPGGEGDSEEEQRRRAVALVGGWGWGVELVGGLEGEVSSSRVRRVIGRRGGGGDDDDELEGLVCPGVRRWIEEEGLYAGE